jgi:glycogen debranching enzyme
LPALCTANERLAVAALAQLADPERFGAAHGPRFVVLGHPTYVPDQYWRGPAWPQLNYLYVLAARRRVSANLADGLATATKRSCLRSGFAEYWNPENGQGLGAKPQTWAAIAAAL